MKSVCRNELIASDCEMFNMPNEVVLEPDGNGNYKMAVPNNFLYKRPVLPSREDHVLALWPSSAFFRCSWRDLDLSR